MQRPTKRTYSPEEDALIIEAIESRPEGMTQKDAVLEILPHLKGRSLAAATFRYYYLKQTPPQPDTQPQPEPEQRPNPLIEEAEQFLQSIHGIVEDNTVLRKENARLQARLYKLEEDQEYFLKLMERARNMGRKENSLS